jgi:hypothetical protein
MSMQPIKSYIRMLSNGISSNLALKRFGMKSVKFVNEYTKVTGAISCAFSISRNKMRGLERAEVLLFDYFVPYLCREIC